MRLDNFAYKTYTGKNECPFNFNLYIFHIQLFICLAMVFLYVFLAVFGECLLDKVKDFVDFE